MKREIFKKVPLSEKKALFREAIQNAWPFYLKGEGDELVTLQMVEYIELKVLVFAYFPNSFRLDKNQKVVLNFASGEDRYFFHTDAEVYGERIHITASADIYVLQRRKSPRLDIPDHYPASLNILEVNGRVVNLLKCKLLDFSSGGCRAVYKSHLPEFKAEDQLKVSLHLNHRRPIELNAEIRHSVADYLNAQQVFGLQFKLGGSMMENKMLVVFMDLQRELFIKWND